MNSQSGGTGWSGAWFNTTATSATLSDDNTSLTYPGTFESPSTAPIPVGDRISTGGIGASSSRLMANTLSLAVDGNVMFASALFKKNAANGGGVTTDNILLEFVDSAGNRRFGLGIEGTGDRPWLNANGSTSPATTVTPGDTYFIVAKIVSSASGTDSAFLKVYGTNYGSEVPIAEPTTWDATLTQTTSAILDRIRVRIDAGNTASTPGEVDEIRIGSDWASITTVPEPTAGALIALASFALARRRRRAMAAT